MGKFLSEVDSYPATEPKSMSASGFVGGELKRGKTLCAAEVAFFRIFRELSDANVEPSFAAKIAAKLLCSGLIRD